jgi:hypothetical protein
MKKIKKLNSKNIKNIVKEHFLDDSTLPEHKIDVIIREYLFEREDMMDDETIYDEYEFSPKTNEALLDMVDGLSEMLDDLEIIKEKEGNVLVFNDVYAEDYLGDVISDLNDMMEDIKYLTELKDNKENDLDI